MQQELQTAPGPECFKGAVQTAGKHPSVTKQAENEVLLPPDSDWPLNL